MRLLFVTPFTDLYAGVRRVIASLGALALPLAARGLRCRLVALRAAPRADACLGSAARRRDGDRLDIDPMYGARLLQRMFPYVQVGLGLCRAARRLRHPRQRLDVCAGGLLSIRVDHCRSAFRCSYASRRATLPGVGSTLLLGMVLPLAWAPMLAIGGDFYELGSIAVSRAARYWRETVESWRGDDVVAIAGPDFDGESAWSDVAGIAASLPFGIVARVRHLCRRAGSRRDADAARRRIRVHPGGLTKALRRRQPPRRAKSSATWSSPILPTAK